MKYGALVITSSFLGFVGAWWLFQSTLPEPVRVVMAPGSPPRAAISTTIPAPATPGALPTFADIQAADTVFDQLYMAWQLAAASDLPALRAALAQTLTSRDPLYRLNIAAILLERYVALDPAGAMAFVTADYRFDQAQMQGHVLTSWVRYDPDAAIAYFTGITDPRLRVSIGARLLEDPTLASSGRLSEVEAALGPFAAELKRQLAMQQADPVSLFDSALTLTGAERNRQLGFAVQKWTEQDPEAALSRILTLGGTETRNMLTLAINTYAQADPEAALTWLQLNQPGETNLQVQVITTLAQRDVQRALQLAEDLTRVTGNNGVVSSVVSVWSSQDPEQALRYVDSLPKDQRFALYQNIAYNYLQKQPAEGMSWLLALGPEYNRIKQGALRVVSAANADIAERSLPRISDNQIRAQLLQGLARYKAGSDPESALDWLENYSGEAGYLPAYQNVIAMLASADPDRAATLVRGVAAEDNMGGVISSVANAWYQRSPDDAISWITSLPSSGSRNQAISSLTAMLVHRDLDRAINLMDELPSGEERENARRTIAVNWARRSPDQVETIIRRLDLPAPMAAQLRALP
ncbi:MAG: hypothetical protein ACFHX7_03540 [Pseudomonadota bacterium]